MVDSLFVRLQKGAESCTRTILNCTGTDKMAMEERE
jgi:hypothetical protein